MDGRTSTEFDRCYHGRLQSRQDRNEGSLYTAAEHGPVSAANEHAARFNHAAGTNAHGRPADDVHAAYDEASHGTNANGRAANDAADAAQHETAHDGQSSAQHSVSAVEQ